MEVSDAKGTLGALYSHTELLTELVIRDDNHHSHLIAPILLQRPVLRMECVSTLNWLTKETQL